MLGIRSQENNFGLFYDRVVCFTAHRWGGHGFHSLTEQKSRLYNNSQTNSTKNPMT